MTLAALEAEEAAGKVMLFRAKADYLHSGCPALIAYNAIVKATESNAQPIIFKDVGAGQYDAIKPTSDAKYVEVRVPGDKEHHYLRGRLNTITALMSSPVTAPYFVGRPLSQVEIPRRDDIDAHFIDSKDGKRKKLSPVNLTDAEDDHYNRNSLNNRLSNKRLLTSHENGKLHHGSSWLDSGRVPRAALPRKLAGRLPSRAGAAGGRCEGDSRRLPEGAKEAAEAEKNAAAAQQKRQ